MKKEIFFSIIILATLFANMAFAEIPAEERAALIALYNSTNGDNWNRNNGWKTPPLHIDGFAIPGTESNWEGVIILSEDNVNMLLLELNNLTGSLPPEIGNFSELQFLILDSNRLSGCIPAELGKLSNLQYISIYQNQLSGCIPPQLGNLGNLLWLELGCNRLSCGIPSELGNLGNLQNFMMESNQLGGGIPPELGNLNNLQSLLLGENRLKGSIPPELGNLSNLTELNLNMNQLSGEIPSELGKLSNLQSLWLHQNQLSGNIPPGLGNLSNMNGCLLNNNQLSGSIPSSFRNLKNLYFFDISYNCLSVADSAIRLWLKAHDPDWEEHQNQCNNGPTLPKVTTAPVVSVTSNTAVCGGNVTSDGGAIVTRGVCWSTGTNPTINDSKTINGMGTGSFSVLIEGLNANTTYHVRAYATNSEGTSYGADVNFTTTEPIIHLSHTSLNFGASILGEITRPQTISIVNAGSGVLNWNVSGNTPWLYFTPSSGRGDSFLTISVNPVDLTAGKYNGTITIKDPQAVNSPQTLSITLQVYDQGVSIEPFGEFTTPLDGSSVYNSIAVTGWVLDDIGVENVKIYNGDSYIGDAVFVEGARPDVETAYPSYPNNFKAGWGYMIVTALLPNGPYHITAKARDWEGNDVLLGTKTITIDNTHASKPFGAIDTPTQGGTASGKNFVNYGWALTPQPNSIPIDGSTINAVIDGVIKGHPIYNIYRSDIAQLFPGYANTDGAVGYYYLDTTKLTNGLHTIAWIVADNVGNSDGIGSRYFSILNSGPSDSSFVINNTHSLPYQESGEKLYFEIKEFERVEIKLPSAKILAGYSVVGDRLKELPVGSTLDKNKNVFYWQPGPGFIGEYHLAFIGKDDEGRNTWKTIVINIKPMY